MTQSANQLLVVLALWAGPSAAGDEISISVLDGELDYLFQQDLDLPVAPKLLVTSLLVKPAGA